MYNVRSMLSQCVGPAVYDMVEIEGITQNPWAADEIDLENLTAMIMGVSPADRGQAPNYHAYLPLRHIDHTIQAAIDG